MAAAEQAELIILGSGPAGYTAALYAARANLAPLLISGTDEGGQLMTTSEVDNWPAAPAGVLGPDLMAAFKTQALRFNTRFINDAIIQADLQSGPFVLKGDSGTVYTAAAVIIATGASAKYLGLPSEELFRGKGVSACATCDGFFFKNQDVAVIGGGNTAVEEALYLANIASKVYLVHRREEFRAEKIMLTRLMAAVRTGKIELKLQQTVHEILGDARGVNAVALRDTATGVILPVAVSGVFVAIGHTPNSTLFRGQLDLDAAGYIKTRRGTDTVTATNIAGVFAAGDVQDPLYRQAVTSAAAGCQAALDAERYLAVRQADNKTL